LVDTLIASDAIDHNAAAYGWGGGPEAFRTHIGFFHGVFRDFSITVDDLVAEDDRVIAFWSFRGIHQGEVWGVQATGRAVIGHTVSLVKVRGGQVIEYESLPDRLALLTQFGELGQYAPEFGERR